MPGQAVLMGDLNMPDPGPERITGYESVARHLTFPAEAPQHQLDHILVRGGGLEVSGSSAVELELSDHRALVAEVSFRS
jgi:endonuclease/exonuclease/phosphatase family metal-dependent hydrolase